MNSRFSFTTLASQARFRIVQSCRNLAAGVQRGFAGDTGLVGSGPPANHPETPITETGESASGEKSMASEVDTIDEVGALDEHCLAYPDQGNAFSLFPSEWEHFEVQSTDTGSQVAGDRLVDKFVPFCSERYGSFSGKTVLELGPYEGYHSHALCKHGATEVISIEANPRNFIKCLIVKNHYQLDSVEFLLGDFTRYLNQTDRKFDFILAAGVLYHLSEPIAVLDRIVSLTDCLGICTTYYDEVKQVFDFTGNTREVELEGADPIILHERINPVGTAGTKHGVDHAAWMFSLADLLRYLEVRDFEVQQREVPVNAGAGPRVQLYARRRS